MRPENFHWFPMDSSRSIVAYRAADWQMMIIPSLQVETDHGEEVELFHVIIDRAGENGVLINRLMTWCQIIEAFKIEV
ncbi:hypothetical protein LCGC14_0278250 [marine sediment metagenome]|uniref:Uncharacterized protein n=1 Tax=marine sediment metagenome TaxID=412755 RepID=A0A0F9UDP1_9ZZZZ